MVALLALVVPALLAIAVAWWLLARVRRSQAVAREENTELRDVRSEEQEGMLEALQQWLREPKIVKVLVHRLKAEPAYLQELLDGSDALNVHELRAVMRRILHDYTVRRVICAHIESTKGLPHREVMAALLDWAQGQRENTE
jgi:hypothetical protein